MSYLESLFKIPEGKIEKIYFLFTWLIRILLIGALTLEGTYQQWEFFFVTALALFLTILPMVIEKKYQLKLPPEFHLFVIVLIYASIYLGEIQNFYYKFYWWDSLLHLFSGFAIGIIGFAIMFILDKGTKIKASPSIVAFFGFCFATTLGVLWEIFEFAMDNFLGMNMQKVHIGTGVTDTMIDFLLNAAGAIIASVIGFFYLKYGKSRIYRRILNFLTEKNPQFLKN